MAIWIGDASEEQEEAPRTALERMREVKDLLDDGLLTDDEFEAKRLQILSDL